MKKLCFLIIAPVFVLFAGCMGESPPPIVEARGVVTLNGAPLPNAQVRFIPQIDFGPEFIATGVTDDEGNYQLQCSGQPGACQANSIVTVTEADIPVELQSESKQRELSVYLRSLKNRPIPRSYGSPASTSLNVTVEAGKPEYVLDLER